MELELGQLELRYERLRLVRAGRERQLLSSLASAGQQTPIVVVADAEGGRFVVMDGYKRVRCLRRLVQDTVRATQLDLEEVEALVMSRQMVAGESETALEQGWLLDEMERRFGLRGGEDFEFSPVVAQRTPEAARTDGLRARRARTAHTLRS